MRAQLLAWAALLTAALANEVSARVNLEICRSGYAKAHRPPYAYTHTIKLRMLAGRPARDYELDHIVPIELGGSPTDPRNLQLEAWPLARAKDREEDRLHRLVCSGRMPLSVGQGRVGHWG